MLCSVALAFESQWGNRCGHNPEEPRLEITREVKRGKGGHPTIIWKGMDSVKQLYFLPACILAVSLSSRSKRRMRSERRESCVLLLQASVICCDILTLRCGRPLGTGGFRYPPIKELAKIAGLSLSRAQRAWRDIVKLGLVESFQPRMTNSKGEVRGVPSVKRLSRLFFELIGLGWMLDSEQKKAYQRKVEREKEQQAQPLSRQARAKVSLVIKRALQGFGKKPKRATRTAATVCQPAPEKDYTLRRAELQVQCILVRTFPDWTPDELRRVAAAIASKIVGGSRYSEGEIVELAKELR